MVPEDASMEVSQPRSNERVELADTEGLTVDRACNALKLNEILVLGSARLTSAVRDAGLQGIAVDFDKSRSQGPHIAVYDLNDPAQFSSLVGFINLERSRIIWRILRRAAERPAVLEGGL